MKVRIRKHYEAPLTSMPVNCCIASRNEIISFLFTLTCTLLIFALSFACDLHRKHSSSFFLFILLQNLLTRKKMHGKFDEKIRYSETDANDKTILNIRQQSKVLCWTVFFPPSFDNCEMSKIAYGGVGSYIGRLSDVVFNVLSCSLLFFLRTR